MASCHAQIMSVDLGHEFFKVALMRQGAPLEIVLNPHSKRKTATAVSFFEAARAFGDDAIPHASKAPSKVPMFFYNQLAHNYSRSDISPAGKWWQDFALSDKFYAYDLGYDVERGVPVFKFDDAREFSAEVVLANIFYFAKTLAEVAAEGKPVKDTVVTVPSNANMRFRQAVVAAGEVAGLRILTLVHEGSAFAVQKAVDYSPEKGEVEYGLFFNMGSRKSEVTVVQMESRQAGMVAGKTAPVVNVLSAVVDMSIGGHFLDLKIALAMLKKFQEKHADMAEGIANNPRALRKLMIQAQKTKAILSANKNAPFIVESLFQDTDFQTTISRDEFEDMCSDMFGRITKPVLSALSDANITMADIKFVEVVGGAWRVPKVQQILADFFEKEAGRKIALGQHLNGEEAAATGAALVGANASSSFRVKKIFFMDVSTHTYAVQVVSKNGEWEKNVTTLYPAGAALGGKKKLTFSLEEDFVVKLFEDGVLLTEYAVTGLEEVMKGKWADYNLTGVPKVNVAVHLESSGIVEIKTPTAICEETHWVNKTKKVRKKPNASIAEESAEQEESDGADADNNSSNSTEEFETIVEPEKVKKKHDKKLIVTRTDYLPRPLHGDSLKIAKSTLQDMAAKEQEVQAVNEVKNALEAAVYAARDKLEGESLIKVTTAGQREEVSKLCTDIDDWVYEGSTQKSDYDERLTRLHALLGPMDERIAELEAREDLPSTVSEVVASLKEIETTVKKDMPWVNASKIEKAQEKLAEFSNWWAQRQDKQKELPLSEAPAFTKVEVQEKLAVVQKEWEKLKKIKKPKEPKEAKKDASPTKTEQEKTPAQGSETLPDTVEAAEIAVAEVKKAKADAIEQEDYDKAQELKKQQELLAKHLASLKEKAEL